MGTLHNTLPGASPHVDRNLVPSWLAPTVKLPFHASLFHDHATMSSRGFDHFFKAKEMYIDWSVPPHLFKIITAGRSL